MKLRLAMLLLLAAAGELVLAAPPFQSSTVLNSDGTTRVSLKVQLERGLRAMRPVEFKFLGEVLAQVKAGTLPKDMVEQAFLWANRQRTYRVQYFEKALRALAKRDNIDFQTKVSSFDPGFNRK